MGHRDGEDVDGFAVSVSIRAWGYGGVLPLPVDAGDRGHPLMIGVAERLDARAGRPNPRKVGPLVIDRLRQTRCSLPRALTK